jgi:putative ABC transport system permease protein
MAAFNANLPTVSGDRGAERIHAGLVTFNFFELLGVRPMLGSGFTSDLEQSGGEPAVVLSHGFWQRWFGADPAVLDSTLTVNGQSYRIAGVMPPGYNHPDPSREFSDAQIWRAIAFDAETATRSSTYLRVIGRLRDGVSINTARAEMTAIARRLELAYPETNAGEQTVVIPLRDQHYSSIRPILLLILGAAGFVLLIVCANVANLVLARSQGRRREFAVRTSLGAGRGRLARQLVAENTIVALAGGAFGLMVVAAGADLLRAMQDSFLSGVADIGVDIRVAGVMVAISLLVGLLFGILPVVDLSNTDLRDVLNEDSSSGGSGRRTHRFRAALVVGQVCIAVALLTGAGLLTRSFVHLVTIPTGFQTRSVLTFETSAPRARYPEHEDRVQFFESVVESLASIPGVEAVGLNSDLPFTVWNQSTPFNFESNLLLPEDAPFIEYHTVGPGYFLAMGIELLAGRAFEKTDGANAPAVAVVNQELARRYWPGVSPVGQRLLLGAESDAPRATVIGVVADVLDDGFAGSPEPSVYGPYMQRSVSGMSVVLRTSVDPASVVAIARQRMREVNPQAPVSTVRPLRDLVAQTVSGERMAMRLAIGFSVLAVLLAAIGIYGLMAFVVGARRREIGIRAAIGADASDILRLVLGQSMGLAALGIVAGTLAGAGVARALASVLFGVEPFDPISFLGSPVLIAAAALAASYVPARRAITVQPVEALRAQ